MKMTVSEYIINFFEDKGVDTAFLVSGGGIMFLTDALAKSDKIKTICNHNEQASSMCADAYAKVKSSIGLCIGTSGPGATNLITGIASSWVDSIPVFALTGQSKYIQTLEGSNNPNIRQYGLQELNIIDIIKPITKYAIMLSDFTSIKYHLEKAYHEATTGRTGPVWLDIPVDIQGAIIESDTLRGFESIVEDKPKYSMAKVIKMIKESKRPVLLVGNGIKLSNAKEIFNKFINKYNIPVVTSPQSADLISYENDIFIGHLGIKGDRAGNMIVANADLILSVGSSLHISLIGYEEEEFAKNSKKIVVDIDQNQLNKHKCFIDIKILDDSKLFLNKLIEENMELKINSDWINYGLNLKNKYPVSLELHKQEKGRVNYYNIIEELNKAVFKCSKTTTICYDSGSAFYVAGQALKVKENQNIVSPGGFGSMGYSLPASMGAYYADKSSIPICITGDGSFQMNIQELEAIKANKMPIKILVINNDGYVSIRNTQKRFFQRFIAEGPSNGVTNPDFSKICNAYDIKYIKLDDSSILEEEFLKILNYDGAIFCEILSNVNQELLPVNTSKKLDSGKMISAPLEDMYPFLDRNTFDELMINKG